MRRRTKVLVLLWAAAVAAAFVALKGYESAPGLAALAPAEWPADISSVSPASGSVCIVMSAHPRCPCTRASFEQMTRLLGRAAAAGVPVSAFILFTVPDGPEREWMTSASWELASKIPGARVLADPQGRLSAKLGAMTSGSIVIYGPGRELRFQGGLTPSRSHGGDCASLDAALAAVLNKPQQPGQQQVAATPVYGCPLVGCSDADSSPMALDQVGSEPR